MSSRTFAVVLASLVALELMGFRAVWAQPHCRTEPAHRPEAKPTGQFTITDIEISNGKIAADASVPASPGVASPTVSSSAAASPAVQVGLLLSTSAATAGKALATACTDTAKSLGPATPAIPKPAELTVRGSLTWTGSSVTIAPLADGVMLAPPTLSGSYTQDNAAKPITQEGYSLQYSSSTVRIKWKDAPLAKSGSCTLTYRYAATPWNLAKYEFDKTTGTSGTKCSLVDYELAPWVTFSIPKSSVKAAATPAAQPARVAPARNTAQNHPARQPGEPRPEVPRNIGISGAINVGSTRSTIRVGGTISLTGTLNLVGSGATTPSDFARNDWSHKVTVSLHDKSTTYTLQEFLQEGLNAFMKARERIKPIYAQEFQVLRLPQKKDWPVTGKSRFSGDPSDERPERNKSKFDVTASASDEWLILNASKENLLPAPIEIYGDADGRGSPLFSGTLAACLPAFSEIDLASLKRSGTDALSEFSKAVNSGMPFPEFVAVLPAKPSAYVTVTVEPDRNIGLVLGESGTITLTDPLALGLTLAGTGDGLPFNSSEGTEQNGNLEFSLSGACTQRGKLTPTCSGSMPFDWNGVAAITILSGVDPPDLMTGPATAAVSLSLTRSATFTVPNHTSENEKWLFLFAEKRHKILADPGKLSLATSSSWLTVEEEINSAKAVDAAYVQRIVLFYRMMEKSLNLTSDSQSGIDAIRAKLDWMKEGIEGDSSDQKDAETRVLQADLDRKTAIQNRYLDEYRRARFGFDRILFEAEQSAFAHAAGKTR